MSERQVYYDGATQWSIPPTAGYPTRKLQWVNTSNSWIYETATYDGNGNRLTTVDPMNHTTTVTYDATYHLFPLTVTNALGQPVSTKVWDTACAMPVTDTGLNGTSDVVTTSYDALCRPTARTFALGKFEQYSYVSIGSPTAQYVEV